MLFRWEQTFTVYYSYFSPSCFVSLSPLLLSTTKNQIFILRLILRYAYSYANKKRKKTHQVRSDSRKYENSSLKIYYSRSDIPPKNRINYCRRFESKHGGGGSSERKRGPCFNSTRKSNVVLEVDQLPCLAFLTVTRAADTSFFLSFSLSLLWARFI